MPSDPTQLASSLPGISHDPTQSVVQALDILAMPPPEDTYNHTVVQVLWHTLAEVANACVVLATVVTGENAKVGEAIGARYHRACEASPRVILGPFGINLSLFMCQILIDLNNTFCMLTADPLEQTIRLMTLSGSGLAFDVLLLALGVAKLLLTIQMMVLHAPLKY